jgi:peptidoglycan/LPS O-acetylase OafA/YrhL
MARMGMAKTSLRVFICLILATIFDFCAHGPQGVFPNFDGRILVLCFLAGVLLYTARRWIPWKRSLFAGAFCLTYCLLYRPALAYFCPLPLAYVTVYLGLTRPRKLPVLKGDYSYGIYLYSWPIQMTLAYTLEDSNSWALNAALALPITLALAMVSWHCVERPFLRLKRFIVKKPLHSAVLEI